MPYTTQQVQQMVTGLLARLGYPNMTLSVFWGLEGYRITLCRGRVSVPVGTRSPAGAGALVQAVNRYGQGDPGPLRRLVEDAVRELEGAEKGGETQDT